MMQFLRDVDAWSQSNLDVISGAVVLLMAALVGLAVVAAVWALLMASSA